jgi:predicted neutral ceramidase superfamily lipid hydrolase
MGQRGCKAAGSVITNAFANSLGELLVYGNGVGLVINVFLLVVSRYMGRSLPSLCLCLTLSLSVSLSHSLSLSLSLS